MEMCMRRLHYILKGLSAFNRLRRQTGVLLDAYYNRLIKEASSFSEKSEQMLLTNDAPSQYLSLIARLKGSLSTASRTAHFIKLIPAFIVQKKKMNRVRRSLTKLSNVSIALASNRLHSAKMNIGPRKYLSLLARSFSHHSDNPSIDNKIDSANFLYICEPSQKSPLWEIRKSCWKEKIFIIDTNFLLFLALIRIFKISAKYFLKSIKIWKFYRKLEPRTTPILRQLRGLTAAVLFAEGYSEVFGGPHNVQAYFFTSNSFMVEILRLYLTQHRSCESICEIMHGIPTKFYERYLAEMLKLSDEYGHDAYQKHSSIPQIPKLPLYGVFERVVKYDSRTAINLHLNKYIIEHMNDYPKFTELIESEYNAIFSNIKLSSNTLIVSFIGGASHYQNYCSTGLFKIECFIMQHIKNLLISMKQPYVIIYTPHPGHSISQYHDNKFFSGKDMVVYKNTIPTWFISDISIGLFSSALFEAVYFGVHSFMPTVLEDEIYPDVLLSLLNHPGGNAKKCFVEALTQFILSYENRSSVDAFSRMKERIKCAPQLHDSKDFHRVFSDFVTRSNL